MTALLLLLAACGAPDPDATGARWDTGSDPRPTTTQPQTLTVVEPTSTSWTGDTGGDPGLCVGDGEPRVQLGTGGLLAFEPYVDGGSVPLVAGPSGSLGLRLDVLSEGLDTTSTVNAVLRVSVDGLRPGSPAVPQDYLALLNLQCPAPGPGWIQVFAPLRDELQADAAAGELAGVGGELSMTLVDAEGEEATVFVDVVFD